MTSGLATTAATILHRCREDGAGARPHGLSRTSDEQGERVEVGSTPGGVSLFVLERKNGRIQLRNFRGETESWSQAELATVLPDPLWDSADSICSHMEADHGDTFKMFLLLVGRGDLAESTPLTMPWVEADGFYLSAHDEHVHVPFPQRCEDANSVRASLITMLRGARAAHSTH